jgi:hypothetical protein
MTRVTTLGLILFAMTAALAVGPAQTQQPAPQYAPPPLSAPRWQYYQQHPEEFQQLLRTVPPPSNVIVPGAQLAPGQVPAGGTWTSLAHPLQQSLSNPILLTDGTVIAHVTCTELWYKFTPDIFGDYVQGTWAPIASTSTSYRPRFFGSGVLPDGRVIIEGGEYNGINCPMGSRTTQGAIYDPVANTWTPVSPPPGWSTISDAAGIVLADGTYMQTSCCDSPPHAALLNPATLTWTNTGTGKFDIYDEESMALLPDGTVLTADAYVFTFTCGTNSERYNPATGTWSSAGSTIAQQSDCTGNKSFEVGPLVMRPNGTAVSFPGITTGTGQTAIYDTSTNTWSLGPLMPSVAGVPYTMADAPAAVLRNGNVLLAMSPSNWPASNTFPAPTHYFELDINTNTFTQVADKVDAASFNSYQANFLVLPTGQIMAFTIDGPTVQIYTPTDNSFPAAWQPVIQSVPTLLSPGGTYIARGLQFSGLTEGAYYGDDTNASTNFPLVRIVNSTTGHVFYARTFNHGTRSIAPNAPGSTSFQLPAGIETGNSTLFVVANGIPSAGIGINIVPGACSSPTDSHDFSGDCLSDVLWYNTGTGQAVVWLINGTTVIGGGSPGSATAPWAIVGQRDFNRDGKNDILWRNGTTGQLVVWLLNGAAVIGGGSPGSAASPWLVAGTGDFNGDGFGDVLWYNNSTGQAVIWFLNGTTVIGGGSPGSAVSPWTIAGTGDFNGDGMSDILWYNTTTGQAVIWLLNGTTVIGGGSPGSAGSPWTIAGTGDFNGDGKSDILWYNTTTGQVLVWLVNGTSLVAGGSLGFVASPWTIAETGDFNNDGRSDVLWYNTTTGQLLIWLVNGATVIGGGSPGSAASPWTVANMNAD